MQDANIPERLSFETFHKSAPQVVSSLRQISQAVGESTLGFSLTELVKIRASQLNACAFCLQYHLNDARKLAISPAKLDLLAAWRDADVYSPRERAALEWTERVTLQAQQHLSEDDFARLSSVFTETEFMFLTVAIGHINFWNRVAAPFRFAPPIPR